MHPFVKWAGGKTQLLNKIQFFMPKTYGRYFEPFVGGGAVLFYIKPQDFVINDFNGELIQAYKCFTDDTNFNKLVHKLQEHQNKHSEEYYYAIRSMDREAKFADLPTYEHAARMIYLNKACFNGLYRVNKQGFFNVPSGKKKIVHCYEEANLEEIKQYFKESKHEILQGDFQIAAEKAQKGDFVYFDPPYDTWEDKESFTSYAEAPFGKESQKRLANVFHKLSDKGVFVMLSNHNTEFIRTLYQGFYIHVVEASRMINSDARGRGKVEEVIITNYEK